MAHLELYYVLEDGCVCPRIRKYPSFSNRLSQVKYAEYLKLCSNERKIVFLSMEGVHSFLWALDCERQVGLE